MSPTVTNSNSITASCRQFSMVNRRDHKTHAHVGIVIFSNIRDDQSINGRSLIDRVMCDLNPLAENMLNS